MTENTPKPRIRVIKKQIEGIRLSFGSILLILCCTFLIILSTFIQFNVNHFVKDAFNFGTANPARPNGIVYENALGDPTRGTRLYCLG